MIFASHNFAHDEVFIQQGASGLNRFHFHTRKGQQIRNALYGLITQIDKFIQPTQGYAHHALQIFCSTITVLP